MFLLDRLEDIEHARFRALAQVLIDKDTGVEAFEDYMRITFPGMTARKSGKDQEMKQVLKAWTSSGPLKVTSLQPQGGGKSRLKQRLVRSTDDRMERLYGRMRRG